jgi:hypothetical protein
MQARTVAALSLLALLAGCADAPPWVQSASAEQIVLRWYPSDANSLATQAAAQAKADAHCAQTGRRAVFVGTELSGSAQLATYSCQ